MNESLYQFVVQFREPATVVALWADIRRMRDWSEATDLPATFDELERELKRLLVTGRLTCVDEKWRPVVRVVESKAKQGALFG